MAKDLFSLQSGVYARYRPSYPVELFEYILSFVTKRDRCWDCATGNGQAANKLADYFNSVDASDISHSQIQNAIQKSNITYHICPAEQTPFADNSFDLITVAQAYHWLDWKKFKHEATRTGKHGAVIAIWAYNLLISDDEKLNKLIRHFYYDVTGPYWDPERKYVDEAYASVDFDFEPLPSRDFVTPLVWSKDHLKGYLQSWSSVQNFTRQQHFSPLEIIQNDLDAIWNDQQVKSISFPVFMKTGRIIK